MHPFSVEASATNLPNLINYTLRLPDKRDFCQNQNLLQIKRKIQLFADTYLLYRRFGVIIKATFYLL